MKTDVIKENLLNELYLVREKYTQIVMDEIITPFCNKYGFEFKSGMGSYYFIKTDWTKTHPKSWVNGHYFESNNGKELNLDTNNKIIQDLKANIDNIFDELTV